MAKKETVAKKKKQKADALPMAVDMTSEELEQMEAISDEISFLPEDMQNALSGLAKCLNKMPVKQREELLDAFDKVSSLMDEYKGSLTAEDGFGKDGEDDDDDEIDEWDYPHYLPRPDIHKYVLRVTIKNHKPAIYRKFCVPSNISLRHLSELLIDLMGWDGIHLNQFRKGDYYYAPAYQRQYEMPVLFGPVRNYNQEDYALSDLLSEKGKTIEWEYDFGDSWYHEVRLSTIDEYKESEALISFVKGERACPPEDCGGIWGYEDLLQLHDKLLRYKKHEGKRPSRDDLDRLDWYDMAEDFDPEEFDTDFAREICDDYC